MSGTLEGTALTAAAISGETGAETRDGAHGKSIAEAVASLDAWLGTMRQPGGYGGPVAHWWQSCYRYTGPGLDWRYEGILAGYRILYKKTNAPVWRLRLQHGAADLIAGQHADGSYRASQFEMNPGTLGTPHEAAATFGLLQSIPYLDDPDSALDAARRNLDNLAATLWDPGAGGFNDRPGIPGRVPNKLATLAQALMAYAERTGDETLLAYAEAAIADILRYQVHDGPARGAVHQCDPGSGRGDNRFFPYYNARCIPALVTAGRVFGRERYRDAAAGILAFLDRTMTVDGSWPQIIYASGRAEWPRWIAGAADILLAYRALDEPVPGAALSRLLASQGANGGFPTAQGFVSQISQRAPGDIPDYRDITPVVGWNDKVFRLLTGLLPAGANIPEPTPRDMDSAVRVGKTPARWIETADSITIQSSHATLYRWDKQSPWASISAPTMEIR